MVPIWCYGICNGITFSYLREIALRKTSWLYKLLRVCTNFETYLSPPIVEASFPLR